MRQMLQETYGEIIKSVGKRSAGILKAVAYPEGTVKPGVISVAVGLASKRPIIKADLAKPFTLSQYLAAEGIVLYVGMSPGMAHNFAYRNGLGGRVKYRPGSQEFKKFIEASLSPIAPVIFCPAQPRPEGPREEDDQVSFIGGSHVANAGCAEKQIMFGVMEVGSGGLLGISNTSFPDPEVPDKSLYSYMKKKRDDTFYICPCTTCQIRLDYYGIKNLDLE